RLFKGEDVFFEVAGVPIFRLPYIEGDLNNPGGPIRNVGIGNDKIFGFQVFVDFDMFNMIGRHPRPGGEWTVRVDYLTKRGPAGGTNFKYADTDLFGFPGKYNGDVKLWGIFDHGTDQLGGGRGFEEHPFFRGRAYWRHMQELPEGFQFM